MQGRVRALLVRDPRIPAGGFETWVETLAQALPEHRIDVTVLVPGDDASAKTVGSRLHRARVIAVQAFEDPLEQGFAVVGACRRLAATGECGVFFSLGYRYLAIAGLNLLRSPWIPLPVIHGRDLGIYEWVSVGPPRRIVMVAENLVPVGERELRKRVGWLRSARRVVAIPNGVAMPRPEAVVSKLTRDPVRPFRVIAVSRLDPDMKRPLDYVDIGRSIHREGLPFTMTIVGSGPLEAEMRQTLARDGLEQVVRMTGSIARDVVYDLLLASDVSLLTSQSEANSLAAAEALACGCAAVISENAGTRHLGAVGVAKLVPVGDIGAFVAALRGFAQSPDEIRRLGRRAQRFAETEYSMTRMVGQYAELVRRLARRARPDPSWRPPEPMFSSPQDALPRTVLSRIQNGLLGIVESLTS